MFPFSRLTSKHLNKCRLINVLLALKQKIVQLLHYCRALKTLLMTVRILKLILFFHSKVGSYSFKVHSPPSSLWLSCHLAMKLSFEMTKELCVRVFTYALDLYFCLPMLTLYVLLSVLRYIEELYTLIL